MQNLLNKYICTWSQKLYHTLLLCGKILPYAAFARDMPIHPDSHSNLVIGDPKLTFVPILEKDIEKWYIVLTRMGWPQCGWPLIFDWSVHPWGQVVICVNLKTQCLRSIRSSGAREHRLLTINMSFGYFANTAVLLFDSYKKVHL